MNSRVNVENIEAELPTYLRENLITPKLEDQVKFVLERSAQGTSVSLLPARSELRPTVVAFFENNSPIIYVTVNEIATLEVPVDGGRYTDEKGLSELLSILRGIVLNGVEQTTWERAGKVVRSVTRLLLCDNAEPVVIEHSSLHNPFGRLLKKTTKYLPYL